MYKKEPFPEGLEDQLKLHEGWRDRPYQCTAGYWTLGFGRNLDTVGISEEEGEFLLQNDIKQAIAQLDIRVSWWREMTETRQKALIDMCFNLGISRLMGFKNMLSALKDGEYEQASKEALDSKWARQVGNRAKTIAEQIRLGK